MKKEVTIYGISGLVTGMIVMWVVATISVNNDYRPVMQAMGMNMTRVQDAGAGHMGMSMNAMRTSLQPESGDSFDKDFLDMMIVHHQGAIQMAELAKAHAKRSEIKKLAANIITAQTTEINDMHMWQTDWGYTGPSHNHLMGH